MMGKNVTATTTNVELSVKSEPENALQEDGGIIFNLDKIGINIEILMSDGTKRTVWAGLSLPPDRYLQIQHGGEITKPGILPWDRLSEEIASVKEQLLKGAK